jgi:Protein of unknown function (DUF2891)
MSLAAPVLDDDFAALHGRRSEMLHDLAGQIRGAVVRRDTDHAIFHGCIDWHSAVHGHWALLAAARLTGDEAMRAFVMERLADIEAERRFIAADPAFEMPYGRAWFLRLAVEAERGGERRLRPMADEIAGTLVDTMKARAFDPGIGSYQSQSWALINLRAWGAHSGARDLVAFVDEHVRVAPLAAFDPEADVRAGSFMAAATNWAWLLSLALPQSEARRTIATLLPDPRAMRPLEAIRANHLHALNFSRAWGLWRVYRATGEARWRASYARHVRISYERSDWWAGDYRKVGHWVAQFGVLALQPLFEPDSE